MVCFICKRDVDLDHEKAYRLKLPTGEYGEVHKRHNGVVDEFLRQGDFKKPRLST